MIIHYKSATGVRARGYLLFKKENFAGRPLNYSSSVAPLITCTRQSNLECLQQIFIDSSDQSRSIEKEGKNAKRL
jgi:hypothetical protein